MASPGVNSLAESSRDRAGKRRDPSFFPAPACRNFAAIPPPMSIARIPSFAFSGIEAVPVEVQVQIAPGLPSFLMV